MKRFVLAFVIICLILPNVFGQDRKNTVYVDIFPMGNGIFSGGAGLGFGYDYSINQYISIGSLVNYFGNFNEFYIAIDPFGMIMNNISNYGIYRC